MIRHERPQAPLPIKKSAEDMAKAIMNNKKYIENICQEFLSKSLCAAAALIKGWG